MRGSETITIKYAPLRDKFGDPIPGSAPADAVQKGCIIWPRTTTEDSSRGEVIIEGLDVFVPDPAPSIPATATIIARGAKYSVEGVPGDYRKRSGQKVGLIVQLKGVK